MISQNIELKLNAIESIIKYKFKNKTLLQQALTIRNSKYISEDNFFELPNYEKLEFLGDSVLNLIIVDYIVKSHPKLSIGDMNDSLKRIINNNSLYEFSVRIGLNEYVIDERINKTSNMNKKVYADILEAIIGGIYFDCKCFFKTQSVVLSLFKEFFKLEYSLLCFKNKVYGFEEEGSNYSIDNNHIVNYYISSENKQYFIISKECNISLSSHQYHYMNIYEFYEFYINESNHNQELSKKQVSFKKYYNHLFYFNNQVEKNILIIDLCQIEIFLHKTEIIILNYLSCHDNKSSFFEFSLYIKYMFFILITNQVFTNSFLSNNLIIYDIIYYYFINLYLDKDNIGLIYMIIFVFKFLITNDQCVLSQRKIEMLKFIINLIRINTKNNEINQYISLFDYDINEDNRYYDCYKYLINTENSKEELKDIIYMAEILLKINQFEDIIVGFYLLEKYSIMIRRTSLKIELFDNNVSRILMNKENKFKFFFEFDDVFEKWDKLIL